MSQTFILDGSLRLANIIRFLQQLPLIKNGKPKRWKLVISEYRAERSEAQNATLWGVTYPPLMEHMGLAGEREREELHEYFCGEYFGWKEYRILGKKKVRPTRTTTTDENGHRDVMPKVDFGLFLNFIQRRAAQHGVFIPDPDPFWFEEERKAA